MYRGHLDVVGEEGEIFESHCLVLVVTDDVLHHGHRRKRLVGDGIVAREVEAGSAVVGRVGEEDAITIWAKISASMVEASVDARCVIQSAATRARLGRRRIRT